MYIETFLFTTNFQPKNKTMVELYPFRLQIYMLIEAMKQVTIHGITKIRCMYKQQYYDKLKNRASA
jgi:hypothetical protein